MSGAIMNAATARSSSMIANTRCRLELGSEKPAMNSAGTTEDPTPRPISPEPMSASASVGGRTRPITTMPALRKIIPARTW